MNLNDEVVSLLLECNDHVSVMIRMLNMDLNSRFDSKEIIEKILNLLAGKSIASAAPAASIVEVEEVVAGAVEGAVEGAVGGAVERGIDRVV